MPLMSLFSSYTETTEVVGSVLRSCDSSGVPDRMMGKMRKPAEARSSHCFQTLQRRLSARIPLNCKPERNPSSFKLRLPLQQK